MKKILVYVLVFFTSLPMVHSQQIVLVKKRNPNQKYKFPEGKYFKIKLKESKEVLKGPWQYVNDSSFVLDGRLVYLPDIYWLDISKKERGIWILRKGQDMLILVGLGLFAVSQVNTIIKPREFKMENKVYTNSGKMLAGGLFCRGLDRTLRPRKVRIRHKFAVYLR